MGTKEKQHSWVLFLYPDPCVENRIHHHDQPTWSESVNWAYKSMSSKRQRSMTETATGHLQMTVWSWLWSLSIHLALFSPQSCIRSRYAGHWVMLSSQAINGTFVMSVQSHIADVWCSGTALLRLCPVNELILQGVDLRLGSQAFSWRMAWWEKYCCLISV